MLPTFTVWGVQFNTFPFVIFAGLIACVSTFMLSHKYNKLYCTIIFRMWPAILGSAAFGARLFSAIALMSTSEYSFWHNLLYGGAVFYGGMIGGAAGLLIVCLARHYEFLTFSDVFVTLLPIGHAIGRMGCYLNGCCYGRKYTGILAAKYTVDGVSTTVFPTWFVEAGFCLVLFISFIRTIQQETEQPFTS